MVCSMTELNSAYSKREIEISYTYTKNYKLNKNLTEFQESNNRCTDDTRFSRLWHQGCNPMPSGRSPAVLKMPLTKYLREFHISEIKNVPKSGVKKCH